MNPNKVGKFILQLRKENHLTQAAFAEMFGVTYQAVSKWENGKAIPDILTLKEICKKFDVDINEILDGEKKNKGKKKMIYIVIPVIVILLALITVFLLTRDSSDFQFKTLTSGCGNFTINGSIAFNRNRSHIYISRIEYCSGTDTTRYSKIEATLYEYINNVRTKIDSYTSLESSRVTLEEFLQGVTFHVDNFDATCRNFNQSEIFLQIYAHDNDNVTTFRIPLTLQTTCPNH